jgi:hypothetical protein
MALRRSNPGDYLLSGLVRCSRCKLRRHERPWQRRPLPLLRLLRPTEARPQRLRRRTYPPRQLEAAVIHQLASLYRDGTLIREALGAATAKAQRKRPKLEEERRALADETRRAERALARYYTAFETGDLDAARFGKRVSALEARLDALRAQDAQLGQQLAPKGHTSPDAADLAGVADNLEATIATADPRQAKALLRLLIKDLRVNGRSEILPTYRVVTDAVCVLPSSVE